MNYLEVWLASWADIACAVISVLTFTLYRPSWDMDIRVYFTKKRLKRKCKKLDV